MITPKKMNAAGIVVRDLERSLAWYKEKFGFEHLFDVPNGVVIEDPDGHAIELFLDK
jgi:catechol 2,3-dioxygenase-like lactoylglutathione lyase family enzyme